MRNLKTEMEEEISAIAAIFFKEQLGENHSSVATFLSGNMFTVRATNCLAPGEQKLMEQEKNWNLLQEVKSQQFEKVKPLLKERLEKITGCEVVSIYSMVGKDGVRFEIVTLSENLEDKLLKIEEAIS
jgi:uncharacterized protein YbcI